jgi:hypothetical protein
LALVDADPVLIVGLPLALGKVHLKFSPKIQ